MAVHARRPLQSKRIALRRVSNSASQRLQLIVDSAFSLIFFRKFLERVQADVKLDFYLAVLDLRKVRGVTRIRERATKIWDRYCDVLPVAPSVQRHLAEAFQPNSKGC